MTIWICGDTETTGVSPEDKIIEVAYAAFSHDGDEICRGASLINPGIGIPSGASAVNGITNAMVADAPTIEEFMAQHPIFAEADTNLVAFNAQFDVQFLKPFMPGLTGITCTLRLAKMLYPGLDSYKLQALRYSLELTGGEAHRADGDVDMMLSLIRKMIRDHDMDLHELHALSVKPMEVTKWPFGKYRDQPLECADPGYIWWALNKAANLDPDLRLALEKLNAKP